jgi:carbon-monoxide dehydrogenase small subunit
MIGRLQVTFEVNGTDQTVVVEPRATLLDALRGECRLTGTRAGCEEGVCGACTVLVDGEPVRACTLFAVQAHGRAVMTVEGLADGDTLHPLQRAFTACHAVQCGACTPGFLMLAAGAFARDPDMDEAALGELAATNLCRCGAGRAIVRALREAQGAMRSAP